jgi:hypothetical protein
LPATPDPILYVSRVDYFRFSVTAIGTLHRDTPYRMWCVRILTQYIEGVK